MAQSVESEIFPSEIISCKKFSDAFFVSGNHPYWGGGGGDGVRGLVEYYVRPRTSSLTKPYGPPLILHFRVRAYAGTRVCRALNIV